MRKLTIIYADFETINNLDNLRVRSWALAYDREQPINTTNYQLYKGYHTNYGIDIGSFVKFVENLKGQDYHVYFNNMRKFDGYFILPELRRQGYKLVPPFEFLTMTEKDLVYREQKDNLKIIKRIAQQRALKILKLFENEVPKDKTKIMKFLKKKWRLVYPKEYKLLIGGNKIYSIKIGVNDLKNGKYRAIDIKCFLSLFKTNVADMGIVLTKKIKGYPEGYFLKLSSDYEITKPYNSVEELENDTNEFNYLLQDCFIILKYGEEMAKVVPQSSWKTTIAATAYQQFLSFYGRKNAFDKGYNNNIINSKTKYRRYSQWNEKNNYTESALGRKLFNQEFPTKWLDIDTHLDMRKWYKGGIVLVNEKYRGLVQHNVSQIDITSSYPNIMNSNIKAPYGEPKFGNSKNPSYDFKFYKIIINNVVHNKYGMPFIPHPKGIHEWPPRLYQGDIIYLTSNSLQLFKSYYNVDDRDISITVKYSFKSRPLKDTFGEYVNYFFNMKNKSEKNSPSYIFAKLMNNALYGKFGTKLIKESTYTIDNISISFAMISKTNYYLPLAIVITELARLYLVHGIGENFHQVIYVDTDSASIINFNPVKFKYIKMGNGTKLGEWTYEVETGTMIARRSKQYAFWKGKELIKMKLSGFDTRKLPKRTDITYLNFLEGMEFKNQTQGVIYKIIEGVKHYLNGCYIEVKDKELPAIWDFKNYKPLTHQNRIYREDYLARLPKISPWNSSLSG